MTGKAECGVDVVVQQNGDGTETTCAVCPFARSRLCPNGTQLPFCRAPQIVNSIDAQRDRDALRRFAGIIRQTCQGPRKP